MSRVNLIGRLVLQHSAVLASDHVLSRLKTDYNGEGSVALHSPFYITVTPRKPMMGSEGTKHWNHLRVPLAWPHLKNAYRLRSSENNFSSEQQLHALWFCIIGGNFICLWSHFCPHKASLMTGLWRVDFHLTLGGFIFYRVTPAGGLYFVFPGHHG